MTEQEVFTAKTGYAGRVLKINLTTGKINYYRPSQSEYISYLGGYGLAVKELWDMVKPGTDPLGPDNLLAFCTGVLTGTGTYFTGRFSVVSKSPASGGFGDSNCGGYFSHALKRCGLDAVFITGKSSKPVYLYLTETEAEIIDASHLWTKDTYETEESLKEVYGRSAHAAVIGPAGEKLSLIAGIATDRGRLAARAGLGAVMGSKNLKALVANGKGKIRSADPEHIRELSSNFKSSISGGGIMSGFFNDFTTGLIGRFFRKSPINIRMPNTGWRQILKKYGTSGLTVMAAESGDSPIKNWSGAGHKDFPLSRSKKIGGDAVLSYQIKKYGCYSCPIRCGGVVEVNDGPYPVGRTHKPEYETLCAFGGLILNDDLNSIFKLNDLANRAGIDTISLGGVIAFAIECYENNLIKSADINGLNLTWGKSADIVSLAEMICQRKGIGDILADGVKLAAIKIGGKANEFAVHCGGIETPMHDPKFDPGLAMTYGGEPAPGRHTVSTFQLLDIARIDKTFSGLSSLPALTTGKNWRSSASKSDFMSAKTILRMLADCAGACEFGFQIGGPLPLFDWIRAATGIEFTEKELWDIGNRICQLRHAFNLREGINSIKDYKPHQRTYSRNSNSNLVSNGKALNQQEYSEAYYKAFHWNPVDGKMDKELLRVLKLDDIIDKLEL